MEPGAPRQPRILLVDDDEVNLLLTAAALREHGFTVIEATGGRAALGLLADWSPDVMVLDAVMPGMDGFRTCEALRDLPGFELMPVLMLTGLDDDASIERAFDAGATDFFVKSNHWSLLAGRLRYLLRTSHIQMELLRSRAKLTRAQDLARMGSFDWRLGRGLTLEPEALRVIGHGVRGPMSMSEVMRLLIPGARRVMVPLLREVVRHSTVLDSDVTLRLPDGRDRILHVEAEPEFDDQGGAVWLHRHPPGRHRPAPHRGQDPPPGQLRCAHRVAQPAPAHLARRAGDGAGPSDGAFVCAAADRPGPLQEHQ